jgi:hypothetical protein
MQCQDPSRGNADQFIIDVSAFIAETIPDTGIRLLRAKPETEKQLALKFDIPRRLELLRRSAERTSALSLPPESDDAQFAQDYAPVGQTGTGETVYLVLSVVTERLRWTGGWWLAVVALNEAERFQSYLASAREAIVLQLRQGGRKRRPAMSLDWREYDFFRARYGLSKGKDKLEAEICYDYELVRECRPLIDYILSFPDRAERAQTFLQGLPYAARWAPNLKAGAWSEHADLEPITPLVCLLSSWFPASWLFGAKKGTSTHC